MVETRTISIARDFSPFPAGRKRADGPFTGERFREDLLVPLLEARRAVVLDLDGVEGLPSSFLEEIFGGLVRRGFGLEALRQMIDFRVSDPELQAYPQLAWRFASAEAKSVH